LHASAHYIAAYAQVESFHAAFYVGSGIALAASIIAAVLIQPVKPAKGEAISPSAVAA
jgi:hypothetical protein